MNFKIIFIAFLFSIAAVAQNTLIPDLVFEQNLITQGIDSGAPDGKVLTANINSLKTLNISNERFLYSRIKDLTGIEDFLALENLNCSYNELKNLDLSKNIAITTLDCSRNNLTQINVSLNTNLVSLECSYNRLSVLNITDNRLLETFICEFNYLTSLNLTNNINLKTLSTGYNRLINIDVSKNILLEKFRCYFNLLIDLDLSKNINIIEVFCGYNKIIRLDLSINKKLEVFSCISNSLTYLNLKNGSNTNLRYISQNSSQPNSSFAYNPDLRCIIVDDLAYSSQKWNNLKDATTGYTQLDYASTIIQSPQVFCVANNQNLNDIVTNYGTLLTWFTTETGSISLPKTTLLTNGMTYYASLTTVSCERRTAVKIFIGSNIKPIPTLTTLPDIIGDCHTNITTIPTATAFCTGLITATTTNPLAYTIPGTYTIVWNYNDGNGNTETQNQKIIISPQPLPIATATQTFCVGQNKTLAAIQILNGINTKWYSDNSNNIVLSNNTILTDQSIYYLSQTINTCESNRIAIKTIIEDTQKPIPTLASLPTITGDCHTQITTIPTATDACAGVITATTASPLRYTLPGTYTIVWNYDDGNGNSMTQNQTVIISAQPLPTATETQTFCVGQNKTLAAIQILNGINTKWYSDNSNNIVLSNNTILTDQSIYYLSQTINTCESNRIAIKTIIEDTQKPIPTLASLPTITGDCHTQITTIPTATDACAGTITATTTSPLRYTLPGTYTIVWNYDDGNGNSITQNQTVIISAQPLPVVTSSQTFCIQQNATLSDLVISGQNIKWYNALTGGNTLANTTLLQNNSTYYASQTINGCESQRVAVLINIQNTQAPTGNSNQQFCSSQNATLGDLAVTGADIKWYDNASLGNNLANTTLVENGTTYYATQTLSGCESPTRLPIAVSLITTLPANDFEDQFCDDLNDGTETIDITNYIIKMVLNTNNSNFTFFKTLAEAEEGKREKIITNALNYKINMGENKVYLRVNANTSTCYGIAELKLTLFAKPIIKISDIIPICENKTIVIDAGSGYSHYLWSNGATTPSIATNNPGKFSVTLTNDYNAISCSNTKNFWVKKSNQAVITGIETQDWTDENNIISVFVTGNGDYEYSIDGNNYQESNQFTGLTNGKKIVYVKDKNGCGTVSEEIFLLMYPRFFTPNGDGYNDSWKIKFSDFKDFLGLRIYDRLGKLLKTFDSKSNDWDGNLNGFPLPSDDYWFTVTRVNGKEFKGHFSLRR